MTAIPPLDLWGDSHPGRQRANNEDCIYIASPKQATSGRGRPPGQSSPVTDTRIADRGVLLIVADGVGGGSVGQVASRFVVDIVAETFYKGAPSADAADDLRQGLERANAAIQSYVIGSNIQTPVASTGTAALIAGDTVTICHVGDSRAYLIHNGLIRQLTRDHTLAQAKLDQGLTPGDEERSILVRSLGTEANIAVDCLREALVPGDRLVLCTDGLYDVVSDEEIGQIVSGRSARKAVNKLIALANRRGGPDNISAIVVGYGMAPPPAWAEAPWAEAWKWGLAALGSLALVALLNLAARSYLAPGATATLPPAPALTPNPTTTPAPPTPVTLPAAPAISLPTAAAPATPLPGDGMSLPTATPPAPATRIATRTPAPTSTSTPTPTPSFTLAPTATPTTLPTEAPPPTPAPDRREDQGGGDQSNGGGGDRDIPSPD